MCNKYIGLPMTSVYKGLRVFLPGVLYRSLSLCTLSIYLTIVSFVVGLKHPTISKPFTYFYCIYIVILFCWTAILKSCFNILYYIKGFFFIIINFRKLLEKDDKSCPFIFQFLFIFYYFNFKFMQFLTTV